MMSDMSRDGLTDFFARAMPGHPASMSIIIRCVQIPRIPHCFLSHLVFHIFCSL